MLEAWPWNCPQVVVFRIDAGVARRLHIGSFEAAGDVSAVPRSTVSVQKQGFLSWRIEMRPRPCQGRVAKSDVRPRRDSSMHYAGA